MVDECTRGRNILDLIFASSPDLVKNVQVISGISDHDAVTADIQLKAQVSKKKARTVFMYDRADKDKLRDAISNLRDKFLSSFSLRNANENWEHFAGELQSIIHKLVPQKIVRGQQKLPWIDAKLRKMIKKKNRFHRRAKKAKPQNREVRWQAYENLQAAVRKSISAAHEKYMNSLFEEEDTGTEGKTKKPSKSFWKTIKAQRRDEVGVPPLYGKKGGKLEVTSKGKAKVLNKQYSSAFSDEDLDLTKMPKLDNSPYRGMPKIKVATNGVKLLLQKLNPSKAVGPDLISTRILKEYADEVAPMLQAIYQQSLDTGNVPSIWKQANVAAIFKKGDKHLASNYRPVSLTCVSCKVLEHIVFRAMMDHVDLHKILVHYQHGFRSKHSCETQLINTIQELAKGLDEQKQMDLLILDFAKAFDKVAHQRLLRKLDYYGIRDNTLNWVSNWLVGRTQRVVVDGDFSEQASVRSGVPQGTVLGPLLFILYINDIATNTSSSIRLFADDCLLYRVVDRVSDVHELQKDLNQLCSWSSTWQMSFNAGKCTVLTITNKKCPIKFDYSIGNQILNRLKNHPYLGVEISDNLDWTKHIDNTVTKSQRTLNMLRRNLSGCTQDTRALAYKALVRPVLEYASTVWDPYHANQIKKIQAVQRKAARFATGKYDPKVDTDELLKTLQWRSLQERRLIARMTLFHKAIDEEKKAALELDPYTRHVTSHSRSSHDRQYAAPRSRLNTQIYSFVPRTIRIWNILPANLVQISDADAFRASLQQQFNMGNMYVVPPRGVFLRPRLGSNSYTTVVGPVY